MCMYLDAPCVYSGICIHLDINLFGFILPIHLFMCFFMDLHTCLGIDLLSEDAKTMFAAEFSWPFQASPCKENSGGNRPLT